MAQYEFDFKALLNNQVISSIKNDNPQAAAILNIFAKHGISVFDTLAILMEIANVISDGEGGENE